MASLPDLAPFPAAAVRQALPPETLSSALAAFSALTAAVCSLPDADFAVYISRPSASSAALSFLATAYAEIALAGPRILGAPHDAATLLRLLRALLTRMLASGATPAWELLADACRADALHAPAMCVHAWSVQQASIEASLGALKKRLVKLLEGTVSSDLRSVEHTLARLNYLLAAVPPAAALFAAGDDFLDGVVACYTVMNPGLRRVLVATGYLCLHGLLDAADLRLGMLADRLYALKAAADAHKAGPVSERDSFVVELVSATPILAQVQRVAEQNDAAGLMGRVGELKAYQRAGGAVRPARRAARGGADKGKGRAIEEEEVHAHTLAKVSEVQDLFPHLGSAFVCKCLDEYGEDVEQVVAHLLDDSLPAHLAGLDRSEQLSDKPVSFDMAPRATPPPTTTEVPVRRNVFDDDELDRLSLSVSKNLRFGKASGTADDMLEDKTAAPSKAAILSALAAFDADDDERDDTYDADDVGAAVENADEADGLSMGNDEVLWKAFVATPDVFARTKEARASAAREKLCSETGLSGDAVEGWAIMVNRTPALRRRLEARFSGFDGTQEAVASTRWVRPEGDSEDEGASRGGPSGRGGGERGRGGGERGRGRGRGGARGGRGGGRGGGQMGEGGGDSEKKAEQKARKGKEASKGARANHHRKEGHAKKMAMGGS